MADLRCSEAKTDSRAVYLSLDSRLGEGIGVNGGKGATNEMKGGGSAVAVIGQLDILVSN